MALNQLKFVLSASLLLTGCGVTAAPSQHVIPAAPQAVSQMQAPATANTVSRYHVMGMYESNAGEEDHCNCERDDAGKPDRVRGDRDDEHEFDFDNASIWDLPTRCYHGPDRAPDDEDYEDDDNYGRRHNI